MTLEVTGTLVASTKIQCLCTLVRVKELRQLDMFSYKVGVTTFKNLKSIILGLGAYFFPVNVLYKKM